MNKSSSDNFMLSLSAFDTQRNVVSCAQAKLCEPFRKRFADFKSRQKGDYAVEECECK